MNTGHPRDVDPSITGQPHQVTGKVPDLMGNTSRTLGNPVSMPAAVRALVPPQPFPGAPRGFPDGSYAAPRCSASHTAVDSRTPSSTARPQCAIQAAIPSGVPET
ncbi:hypothetical protein SAMN05216533_3858 [Streptomyces sp. Ag109_O5-10]|nr:hypothetical protein SAMN05216533_3858 [Streptomyces sp. Ag109_O5-10]